MSGGGQGVADTAISLLGESSSEGAVSERMEEGHKPVSSRAAHSQSSTNAKVTAGSPMLCGFSTKTHKWRTLKSTANPA